MHQHWVEPAARVGARLLVDRHRANHVGDELRGLDLVGGEGYTHMAVRDDRLISSVSMGKLGEILHDQIRPDAIARQIRERGLEYVHSSERRELVEHQKDRIPVSVAAPAFREIHCLGESAHDLLEQQPQKGASPVDVRGRDREVETHPAVVVHDVPDGEVRRGRVPGHHRITVEVQELHG